MKTARQVLTGTLRLVAGVGAAKVLNFALYILLARYLGVEGFGRYTFALSFTLLFTVLADLGLGTVFTREVSRAPRRARALVMMSLRLKALLALVTLAGTIGISVMTRAPDEVLVLVSLMTVGLLANSAGLLFDGLLRADGRAGASGLSQLVQSVGALVCGAALLGAGVGPVAGAAAFLLGGALHVSASAWWSRGLWLGLREQPESGGRASDESETAPALTHLGLLREAAPVALSGIFIALYFRIDAVMLNALQNETAVGLYGGIFRLFEALGIFGIAFRSVLFPVMSRAADGPREALAVLCRKSLRVHLLFTVGVAVVCTFNAESIIRVSLGPEFLAAAPALMIIIWALPAAYMADTLVHLLTAQRRQLWGTFAVGVTALVNVGLNLMLIPRFSFTGAAGATVASELICFGLLFAMFRRGAPRVGVFQLVWRPLAAGVLLAGALTFVTPSAPAGVAGLAGRVVLSAVFYLLLLVLLRAVGRDDWTLVRSLLPGRRAEATT